MKTFRVTFTTQGFADVNAEKEEDVANFLRKMLTLCWRYHETYIDFTEFYITDMEEVDENAE